VWWLGQKKLVVGKEDLIVFVAAFCFCFYFILTCARLKGINIKEEKLLYTIRVTNTTQTRALLVG